MSRLGAEVVIATRNAGKVKEFAPIFEAKGMAVKSLLDFAGIPDIVEDGATFAENALIKASFTARRLGVPVVADDSGLCVDRLGGAPGVYSARYAGEGAGDEANNCKLLAELAAAGGSPPAAPHGLEDGVQPLSTGRFVCVIALVDASGELAAQSEGVCEGWILSAPRGEGGFGYDPLFYVPELGRTLAELTVEEKNRISHRGKAIEQLWKLI